MLLNGVAKILLGPLSLAICVLVGGCLPLSASLTTPAGPKETFKILGPDSQVNSRAFASAYPLDGNYIVCFSKRPISTSRYSIFCQDFENLRSGVPNPLGSEFGVLNSLDAGATTHIYTPYIFEISDGFRMVFTARGSPELENDEWVGLAESSNGREWRVAVPRAFDASEPWEANDVENFGLLLHNGVLWMNYESTGPSGLESERSIGIAYSLDEGESWIRVSTRPSITGGVYCAGFFVYESEVYLIASAHNQFRVYRAATPALLSDKSYIGSFLIQNGGRTVDTPSAVTDTVEKLVGGGRYPLCIRFQEVAGAPM